MSKDAMLPCFVCGKTLPNVSVEVENQPYGGTEFRTYGHYGSTFWDSFDGEELVLTICDECLGKGKERLAQHKRFLPVRCNRMTGFGQQWVDRPMVPYSGNVDDGMITVEPEELDTALSHVEWVSDIEERKVWTLEAEDSATRLARNPETVAMLEDAQANIGNAVEVELGDDGKPVSREWAESDDREIHPDRGLHGREAIEASRELLRRADGARDET